MPDPKTHTVTEYEERGGRWKVKVNQNLSLSSPPAHPGVLPLVRHGDHVSVEQVLPVLGIAATLARLWRLWLVRIPIHPRLHNVMVELFGPQEACITCTCMGVMSITLTLEWRHVK